MKNILVTGATGNIGKELIPFLLAADATLTVTAGVRKISSAQARFRSYPELKYVHFDFEAPDSFAAALAGVDTVFLLRPPHLADVKKYFEPLLQQIRAQGVQQILFLSVQGADKSSLIPHHKIERLIQAEQLDYIFVRPSYFMQNLTTTLLADLKNKRQIILPAGRAPFNWVDINNIAEACAILLQDFERYKNQVITITGRENISFGQVASLFKDTLNIPVEYIAMNPLRYYFRKRREGVARGLVIVMILLHYLPRFQAAPTIADWYERLSGKQATSLRAFLKREAAQFR